MKELYSFKVKKDEEEKTVFLKKPGAKDTQTIGIVYAAEYSKALKMGIMSQADIRRIVLDDGGFTHPKLDKIERGKILTTLNEKENEYQRLTIENGDTKEVLTEILSLRSQIQEMDSELTKIYGNSAELIANQQTLVWIVANLTFWEDKTLVFQGDADYDRIEAYFDALDGGGLEKTVAEYAYIFFQGYLLQGIKETEQFDLIYNNIEELEAVLS